MQRIRVSRLMLVTASILIISGALTASPSAGSTTTQVASPRSTSGCAVLLEPTGPADAKGVVPTKPTSLGCYASEAQEIAGVAAAKPASLDTLYWLATGYGHVDFGGAWIAFYGGSPCSTSVQGVPNIEAYAAGWGNRIRSSQGTCNHTQWFASTLYGGGSIVCSQNCNHMGALEANANSVYFYN